MPSKSRRKPQTKRTQNQNFWAIVLLIAIIALWFYTSRESPTAPPTTTEAPTPTPTIVGQPPAPQTGDRNLALGNPSGAVPDVNQPTNYLIERPQYTLSYNRDRGIPNWVSWQLASTDLGDTKRTNVFLTDSSLPKGWFQVSLDDYTGSGYDRGHLCPSADRTASVEDNQATFLMTNIMPQAPDNNRNTWENLESFSRNLVNDGHTLYIIAGGDGSDGTLAKGKITIPSYTWKIVVVMPKGTSDISQITADTPVIAVRIPNGLKAKLGDWEEYRVSVATIEQATGYTFFTTLAPEIQQALKANIAPVPSN